MLQDTDFDGFLNRAWDEHVADPALVAERLNAEAAGWLTAADRLPPLVQLVHHVHGGHLGRWTEARGLIQQLMALPASAHSSAHGSTPGSDATGVAAARRALASLDLCEGLPGALDPLDAADRIRVAAMAATNLAERDAPRAALLFEQALAEAAIGAWPAGDPVHRALAASGNNLAVTLEEKPERSTEERVLMISAATAARTHWALGGGWLEVERAEYRLAMSWLKAGDPVQALAHAQAARAIVEANDAPALERFYAWQAIAKASRAAGDSGLHHSATAQARQVHGQMDSEAQQAAAADLQSLDG